MKFQKGAIEKGKKYIFKGIFLKIELDIFLKKEDLRKLCRIYS